MALDLTGITNEREFYTDHYIDSVLEDDLRPVFARWTAGADSPVEAFRRCGATWPAMHAELEGLTDPGGRLDCQRAWLRTLLDALGYPWQPGVRETEDGIAIPIAGEITRADGSPELWLIEALDATNELSDPLSLPVLREQLPPAEDLKWTGDATLEDVLTEQVFASEEPPRWVLYSMPASSSSLTAPSGLTVACCASISTKSSAATTLPACCPRSPEPRASVRATATTCWTVWTKAPTSMPPKSPKT